MTDTITVAADDGFADIKLAWYDDKGALQTFVVPATAETGFTLKTLGGSDNINAYVTGDERFTVADSANNPIDTRFPDYYCSSLNRTLIHHALFKAGFVDQKIALITGVPPGDFQVKLETIEERKAQSFAIPVYRRIGTDEKQINEIVSSDVGAQAISAYINLRINDDGERNVELDGESVAVVDIGGGTTDIIALQDVEGEIGLIDAVTHSAKIGLLKVYELIRKSIINQYDVEVTVRKDLVDIFKTGQMKLYGVVQDLSEIVAQARQEVAREIVDLVNQRLRAHPRISQVIFVGGGAEALREEILAAKKGAIIDDDARFANAKGMLKFKRFLT